MKFNIIYADPPWSYNDKSLNKGGALRHYNTMTIDEICSLPISEISDNDCVLFIWATFPKLNECFKVIDSWGFDYKTCAFVWIKTNKRTDTEQLTFLPEDMFDFDEFMGMGRWTRSNAEICLLATKGTIHRKSAKVRQVIYAPIERHSKKPNETRDRIIELVGDLPKVELFARQKAGNWDTWGNEVESTVELVECGVEK
jgi:site-specific DNA-methyltransferase (adenine-specific)